MLSKCPHINIISTYRYNINISINIPMYPYTINTSLSYPHIHTSIQHPYINIILLYIYICGVNSRRNRLALTKSCKEQQKSHADQV